MSELDYFAFLLYTAFMGTLVAILPYLLIEFNKTKSDHKSYTIFFALIAHTVILFIMLIYNMIVFIR